jgi:hypothetical protein
MIVYYVNEDAEFNAEWRGRNSHCVTYRKRRYCKSIKEFVSSKSVKEFVNMIFKTTTIKESTKIMFTYEDHYNVKRIVSILIILFFIMYLVFVSCYKRICLKVYQNIKNNLHQYYYCLNSVIPHVMWSLLD